MDDKGRTGGATRTLERIVQWADADPAGHINTPRAFDFAAEAIEAFYRAEIGISYLQLIRDHGLGQPTVHASCDFVSRVMEGESVTLTLYIERIGRSSITWRVDATHVATDAPAFHVTMISSIISMESGRAVAIPPAFRAAMEPFVARP